jgi:hypothetical protein
MAKDLYKDGNYVIAVNADGYQREFPMGKTVYAERDGKFIITEGQIEGQEIEIDVDDAVNWIDGDANAYSEATMRDFLRANTGFNVASGGNGAERLFVARIAQTGVANPAFADGFIIHNSFTGIVPKFTRVAVGIYQLITDESPDVLEVANAEYEEQVTSKEARIFFQKTGGVWYLVTQIGDGAGVFVEADGMLDGLNSIIYLSVF